MGKKELRLLALTIAVGVALWVCPSPEGVSSQAWRLFAIFAAMIVGIVLKPLPMGVVALIGLACSVCFGILTFDQAFSGFSNDIVWLIVFAFFISRGFILSGLGNRMAYQIMSLIGKNSLGLGYGLVATDLVIAPLIPSMTARGGGVIYPLLKSVADIFTGPSHDPRMGAFLTLAAFQGTAITGAMFLTSMAGNPLIAEFARVQGIHVSWLSWALAASVPGLISLIVMPYITYKLVSPTIRHTPKAKEMALSRLEQMGSMKFQEWVMLFTFLLLIVLWVGGIFWGIKPTVAAMIGLSILLLFGIIRWKDVLEEHSAWDTFIWFSTLVTIPSFLNQFGFATWFSNWVVSYVAGFEWIDGFIIIALVYFYSHYLFASNVGHISTMYVPFLIISISLGTPPHLAALVLGFFSSLFGGLTHYGSGPAPILFGSGYVTVAQWWKIGAVIGFINIAIWMLLGGIWWKFLGLW